MEKIIELDRYAATRLFMQAMKVYAITEGLDPEQEIKIAMKNVTIKKRGVKLLGQIKEPEDVDTKEVEKPDSKPIKASKRGKG